MGDEFVPKGKAPNPYEPPATSSKAPRDAAADGPISLLRIYFAIAVTSAVLVVAYLPAPSDPVIAVCGPVWMLKSTPYYLAGIAIAAFCAFGLGSLIVRPRWYTGLFAWAALAAWVGTSFYMLLLTSPD